MSILNYLYSAFGYVLEFFYKLFGSNYVLAIVLFTVVVRLLLLPTSIPQQKNQAKQFRIQPKMQKLQEKFGRDRQRLQQEQQDLYSREGFNPMAAGCGPMLVTLPLLWGVYGAITRPLSCVLHIGTKNLEILKQAGEKVISGLGKRQSVLFELPLVNEIGKIKDSALALGMDTNVMNAIEKFADSFQLFGMSLCSTPSIKRFDLLWLIPILSGVTSLLTSLYSTMVQKKINPVAAKANAMSTGCMMAFMPLFSIYICFTLPAGVGFYWVCSNIMSLVQTMLLSNLYSPPKVAAKNMILDTINRYAREKNIKENTKVK